MPFYYDRDGTPISGDVWAMLFTKDRGVARTEIMNAIDLDDCCLVSTVWLGLDQNWTGVGGPLIFESMVFRCGQPEDVDRYSTLDAARAGHQAMVDATAATFTDPVVIDDVTDE